MTGWRAFAFLMLFVQAAMWRGETKATAGELIALGLYTAGMLLLGTTPREPKQ